jgi:hypothetical protein
MGEPVREYKTGVVDVDGLEDVFDADVELIEQGIKHRANTVPAGYQQGASMSLKAACRHYKLSASTLRAKIKNGEIPAQKIQGANGPEWRVFPAERGFQDSSQQGVEQGSKDGVNTLPTGHQGIAAPELNRLLDLIEKQAAKLETASGQIGYLQSRLEERDKDLEERDNAIKLLRDSQHKRGWWARLGSWFVGK